VAVGTDARSTFLAIVKGDASQAVTEFKKLGNSVEKSTKGAEGSVGKFQKFTSGAFSELKANAGMMAAGAGAAIGAFALASINKFADLGVAIGKFSDATGVATDDASRWVEVAGDIGIEMGTVEKALGRLNRSIDEQKFAELGIEIARTKDGATDVSETFLNVIDRLNGMKDPAERARVAQQLLGKGWQEMAELISQGSGTLRASLADVSDAKVFDQGEVKRARDVRAAMDKLKDVVDDLALTVGNELAPAFADFVDTVSDLAGPLGTAWSWLNKINSYSPTNLVAWGERLYDMATNSGQASDKLNLLSASAEDLTAFLKEHNVDVEAAAEAWARWNELQPTVKQMTKNTADEIGTLNDKNKINAQLMGEAAEKIGHFGDEARISLGILQALNEELAGNKAAAEFRVTMGDAAEAQAELNKEFAEGKLTAQEYWDQSVINVSNGQQAILDYGAEIDSLDPDVLTKIVTTYDPANPEQTVAKIQRALDNERLYIKIQGIPVLSSEAKKLMEYGIPKDGKYEGKKGKANGGPISGGTPYLVGERGPELIVPSANAMVLDASRTQRALGGGSTVVNVYPRMMPTDRELIDLVNSVRRKQGAVI
jgi:hypothetical protein